MIPMRVMQVAIDQVIDVVAVRYSRMPAIRAVDVVFVVALAFVMNAPGGVDVRNGDDVLVVMVFMGTVQVPVVQVPHMVPVPDGYVTAVRAVFVRVIVVDSVSHGSNLRTLFMNGCGRVGVVEDIPDERFDVSIRQSIEHVPSVAPARDEVLLQKDPQTLRSGGHLRVHQLSDLRDLVFPGKEEFENSQAGGIAPGAEHTRGSLDDRLCRRRSHQYFTTCSVQHFNN